MVNHWEMEKEMVKWLKEMVKWLGNGYARCGLWLRKKSIRL
jgi:hypothetical protein